jgi:hypothetical protein
MSTAMKSLGTALVLLSVLGLTYFLFWMGSSAGMGSEIRLPMLAIAGIVSLLVALTLAALAYAAVGMSDKNQALALPDGSVRAVIALSLVVLFAICSVYLFGSLANGGGDLKDLKVDSIEEAKALVDRAARPDATMEVISVFPPLDGTATPNGLGANQPSTTNPPPPAPKGPFTVRYRYRLGSQAADFAKQLLVLIGTLVTSVASFYFGSRAVQSARNAVSGTVSPKITAVSPKKLRSGETNEVTIAGSGLDSVDHVKLVQGDNIVLGKNVQDTESSVICTIEVDQKMAGDWSLVVETGDSQIARFPVQIEAAAKAAAAADGV